MRTSTRLLAAAARVVRSRNARSAPMYNHPCVPYPECVSGSIAVPGGR